MIRYTFAVLLVLCSIQHSYAGQGMGPGPGNKTYTSGGSGGCETQSVLYTAAVVNEANLGYEYDTTLKAGAIKVVGNGKALYSVSFKTGPVSQGSSHVHNILLNSTLDFTSGNITTGSITTPGVMSTVFTGLFAAQPVLTNAATYYIAVAFKDGTWDDRFSLSVEEDATENGWSTYTGLAGMYQLSGKAIWAEVKVCD